VTSSPAPDEAQRWWRDGERAVADRVQQLTDAELAEPSALPGWSRAHVVAHLARNADALVNLLAWARTGVETPMYPSRAARDADIEAAAALPPDELRLQYVAACDRLTATVDALPAEAWTAEVRTPRNEVMPAGDVPWMRAKEVWVHGTDLRAGLTFADAPTDFCAALVDDVLALFARRGQTPDLCLVAPDVDRTWGSGQRIEAPVATVAAWLTRGETSGLGDDVPPPPAWI